MSFFSIMHGTAMWRFRHSEIMITFFNHFCPERTPKYSGTVKIYWTFLTVICVVVRMPSFCFVQTNHLSHPSETLRGKPAMHKRAQQTQVLRIHQKTVTQHLTLIHAKPLTQSLSKQILLVTQIHFHRFLARQTPSQSRIWCRTPYDKPKT